MFAPAHLRAPRRDRAILGAALGALVLVAWLTLALWEGSPFAAYLGHAGGVGPLPLEASLFAVGWVLMIVAMMIWGCSASHGTASTAEWMTRSASHAPSPKAPQTRR